MPKVFYVDGGYEYWGRAASLAHTTVDGTRDVGFLPSERRYVISSAQHSSPARFPPAADAQMGSSGAFRGDPLDQRLALRALLVALIDWVKDGRAPPPSLYPTIADRSLVPVDSSRRPEIPGVAHRQNSVPAIPHSISARDGARDHRSRAAGARRAVCRARASSGLDRQRSRRHSERRSARAAGDVLPVAAAHGRGVGSARELRGHVRAAAAHGGRACSCARSAAECGAVYPSREAFLARVDSAAAALVAQRFLLPEDASAAHARMAATWDWLFALPPRK